MTEVAIIARVLASPLEIDAIAWNALLTLQSHPTPFMQHEYFCALHESGSATPETGWTPRFMTLWHGSTLIAACPLYLKSHSRGEYVFDWAWASAYGQHGIPYYPKAVVAVPFTPVSGSRWLARDAAARTLLIQAVLQWSENENVSSLHMLFASHEDVVSSASQGLMLRHTVQFHWENVAPTFGTTVSSLPPEGALTAWGRPGGGSVAPTFGTTVSSLSPERALTARGRPGGDSVAPMLGPGVSVLPAEGPIHAVKNGGYRDFEHFLASLSQEKRKKIRQERRRVADAGVLFRWAWGKNITTQDWDFFYCCYERTYQEHGNPPYLTRDFFARMAHTMPHTWLLFVGERNGIPIASSLIALNHHPSSEGVFSYPDHVAYGRYWGALERVDCLHFEACYYQPLQWCINHGVQRFEGGAQGEHKMARALLPVQTTSAHWLAHPAFSEAVERFLAHEGVGVHEYLEQLQEHSPFRKKLDHGM